MAVIQSLKSQYQSVAFKSMGTYAVTNFFIKGISFLLLPIFTNPNYLSPSDNGLLSLFSQSILFLMPFISLGILQSASVDYFKLDKKQFKDFCTTGFVMSSLVALIFVVIFWCFKTTLYNRFKFPLSFFWIIPAVTFFTFCIELLFLIIRNRKDPAQYMQVSVVRILLDLALAVILIVGFSLAWKGRVTSILVSTFFISLYGIFFLKKNNYLGGQVRMNIITKELKYSIPIIAMQLSNFCLFSSDSFLLSGITKNNSEVGIYGMACLFASIIFTLCSAIVQYIVPKINHLLSQQVIDYPSIRKQFNMYFFIMATGLIALLLAIPLGYKYFINHSYLPGLKYYYFLCTGYFFWAIAYFFYTFLFYYKQKLKLLLLSLLSILISLISNYCFIKNMGTQGAAISVCCSYFVVLIMAVLFTKSNWKHMIKHIPA